MYLQKLCLNHYRNIENIELSTNNRINIFIGSNAQGKTNLLESIYVLALTKSHRTNQDKELVEWNQDRTYLSGDIQKKYGDFHIDLTLTQKRKKARINGLEQKKIK